MSESDDSWESDDSDGDIGTGLLFENFSSTIFISTYGFYCLRSFPTLGNHLIEETEFDTSAPKPIKLNSWVNSAKFHPDEKLLVAGDFDGYIKVWSFDNESEEQKTELKLSGKAHSDTIRAVNFSRSGRSLFSIGTDRQLLVSGFFSFVSCYFC